MRVKMPLLLCLSLLSLINSSCVTIKDKKVCAVAGVLSAGANCSNFISNDTEEMSFDQFLDFLEPRIETPTSTGKGAALCMSSEDFGEMKTEIETMCRMLGDRCAYSTKKAMGIVK